MSERTEPPKLYTMEEAAEHLRVSRRWLQDFIKRNPFYRVLGGRKLFTAADMHKLYEAAPCPSSSSADTAPRTGTSAARSEASEWTRAQNALSKALQKRLERAGNRRARRRSGA